MKLDALGVRVTLGRSAGAEVIDEAPDGVAALAGLHRGDVINAVDGKPVRTPMELAAELANRQAGDKLRLGYLIHGEWQAETVVLLGH
jgi:S1-C subfamily serine protease